MIDGRLGVNVENVIGGRIIGRVAHISVFPELILDLLSSGSAGALVLRFSRLVFSFILGDDDRPQWMTVDEDLAVNHFVSRAGFDATQTAVFSG